MFASCCTEASVFPLGSGSCCHLLQRPVDRRRSSARVIKSQRQRLDSAFWRSELQVGGLLFNVRKTSELGASPIMCKGPLLGPLLLLILPLVLTRGILVRAATLVLSTKTLACDRCFDGSTRAGSGSVSLVHLLKPDRPLLLYSLDRGMRAVKEHCCAVDGQPAGQERITTRSVSCSSLGEHDWFPDSWQTSGAKRTDGHSLLPTFDPLLWRVTFARSLEWVS